MLYKIDVKIWSGLSQQDKESMYNSCILTHMSSSYMLLYRSIPWSIGDIDESVANDIIYHSGDIPLNFYKVADVRLMDESDCILGIMSKASIDAARRWYEPIPIDSTWRIYEDRPIEY